MRPLPQNQHGLAGLQVRPFLAPQYAGQGLGKGRLVQRHAGRHRKDAAVDVNRRNPQVLSQAAGIKTRVVQRVANGVVSAQAVTAGVAGHVVGDHRPVALFEPVHALAHLGHHAGNLVPQNQGRPRDAVPLHHVAAAKAAGFHPQQQLAGADGRNRHLLQPHVQVVVVHCHAQTEYPFSESMGRLAVPSQTLPNHRTQRKNQVHQSEAAGPSLFMGRKVAPRRRLSGRRRRKGRFGCSEALE